MRSLVTQEAPKSFSVGPAHIFTTKSGRAKIELPGNRARNLTVRDFAEILNAVASPNKLLGVVEKIAKLTDPRAAQYAFDA